MTDGDKHYIVCSGIGRVYLLLVIYVRFMN